MTTTSSISAPIAHPVSTASSRGFSAAYESLRPVSRGFVARLRAWFGQAPVLSEPQRRLARLAHTEVRYQAALARHVAGPAAQAEEGGVQLGDGLRAALRRSRSDPGRLFDAMRAHAGQNAPEVHALLASGTPDEVVAALAAEFRRMGDRWQAQSRAELVHAALSTRMAVIDAQYRVGARGLEVDWSVAARSEGSFSKRLAALDRVEAQLKGAEHPEAHARAQACGALRAELSAQLRDVPARVKEVLAGTRVDSALDDIKALRDELAWMLQWLEADPGTSAAQREQARVLLGEASEGLALLETRGAKLGAHRAACPLLTSALEKLDARGYMLQALRIQRVLAAVGPGEENAAWKALEGVTGGAGGEFVMLEVLCDVQSGAKDAQDRQTASSNHESMAGQRHVQERQDNELVDRAFGGETWLETAALLKHARIDRAHARERLQILLEQPPERRPALLEALEQRTEQRRRAVDVQHNLRIARNELDRLLRLEAFKRLPGAAKLPAGAFSALAPSAEWIRWLRSTAPQFVHNTDLMIANWIRLSFTDPNTQKVDEARVRPLLAQLDLPEVQAQQLQQWVAEGFSSAAAVATCRRQIQHFATALRDAALVGAADERQDERTASQRVVKALLAQVCGHQVAVASGEPTAARVRRAVREQAPWIGMEAGVAVHRAMRDQHLAELSTPDWARMREGPESPRQWLRDAAQRAQRLPQLQPLLNLFDHHRRVRELQQRKDANPKDAAVSQELGLAARALADSTRALERLDLTELRILSEAEARQRGHTPPSTADLLKLEHHAMAIRSLSTLSRVETEIEKHKTPDSLALVDRLVAIAILQEALASGDPAFRLDKPSNGASHVAGVLKRLRDFGLGPEVESPTLRVKLASVAEALARDGRTLAELNKALAPRQGAVAKVRALAGLSPSTAPPAAEDEEPSATPEDERAQANAAILERRFGELQPNQSFAIFMGQYGDVVAAQPVVPGISVTQEVRLERSSGINVSRLGDGRYQVHLQDGLKARCGVSLASFSQLLQLTGSALREQRGGHRFTFTDRAACERFVQALARGDATEPQLWADAMVEATQTRESGGALVLAAKAEAAVGGLSLAALSAEVGASARVSRSSFRTAQGEVVQERWQASQRVSGRAEAAGGRLSVDGVAGRDLAVERSLVRQYGLLQPGSGLAFTATVVGGKVDRCLAGLLPHLPADSAELRKLQGAVGEVADGTAITLSCRLSEAAIRQANQALGDAQRELIAAGRSRGAAAEQAKSRAREQMAKMQAVLNDPSSYVPEGLGLTSGSEATAARRRGLHHAFATVSAQATRSLALEGAAALPVLTTAYRPLLG
ncbi:hypothetical protein [Ramlibacter rhizophilus]|uniref:Uncharacterized protein n=1 Tax=Ramlibacter rhizophilus TaxID=1781167 RepID=A0A4Z0BQE4_9BURK|nr:hypothetical protein [Ramlibacter rhizophilus]TFZ01507.1 hypothetical protein EZ242_09040 [Ramlibacter rhizophilus]